MSDPASDPPRHHPFESAVRFDGGDLDCGSGLLLQIRRRIDPLDPGQLLEIHSTEPSVAEDLPAWCRLTGNELVSTWHDREQGSWSFLISKNRFSPVVAQADAAGSPRSASLTTETSQVSATSAGAGARGSRFRPAGPAPAFGPAANRVRGRNADRRRRRRRDRGPVLG